MQKRPLKELSNDQYDTLFHLSPKLDEIENYLRDKGKVKLADDLLKFQIDAGNTYQSEVVQKYQVPENTVKPSVEAMKTLFQLISNATAANKEMQNEVHKIRDELNIPLPDKNQGHFRN